MAHDDISWIRKTDKCIWYLVYFSLFQTYRYTLLSLFFQDISVTDEYHSG